MTISGYYNVTLAKPGAEQACATTGESDADQSGRSLLLRW